jgi:hydroxypyruvate reductase
LYLTGQAYRSLKASARNDTLKSSRQHLFEIYKAALQSVQGESCVHESLKQHALDGSVAVVAIGKAAASMMNGAISALEEQLEAGLIITKSGHCEDGEDFTGGSAAKRIQCFEAGHPVPNENSLSAGKERRIIAGGMFARGGGFSRFAKN